MTTPEKPPVDHDGEFRLEQALLQPTLIAALAASASKLGTVAEELVKSALISRVQRTLITLGIAVILLMTAVIGAGVVVIYKNTRASRANSDIIRSCTTPGGECYKRTRAQTGDAVANINRVVVAAAYCARVPGNDTQAEVETCVKKIILN